MVKKKKIKVKANVRYTIEIFYSGDKLNLDSLNETVGRKNMASGCNAKNDIRDVTWIFTKLSPALNILNTLDKIKDIHSITLTKESI